MDTKQLGEYLTTSFNRLANEMATNKKAVKKLPKCSICGHYTSNLEIHNRYNHS